MRKPHNLIVLSAAILCCIVISWCYNFIKITDTPPITANNNYNIKEKLLLTEYELKTILFDSLVVVSVNSPIQDQCSGTSISFNATVTGGTGTYSYLWDFGDGDTSTQTSPAHSFSPTNGCGSQTYTVQLTVTDGIGTVGSGTTTISVLKRPHVDIEDADVPWDPFRNCDNNPTPSNPNYTINVNNISNSSSCTSSYTLNWGDGTSSVTNLSYTDFPLTHTYTQLGAFDLTITAYGSNGCNSSKTYVVANQTNPAGSLGTLGNTTGLCAPETVPFTISNWEYNSPGTEYTIDFGDGESITLQHPLNTTGDVETINHLYTTSSCPDPTFTATLTVTNACDGTPYTAGNIQIRIQPEAEFTAPASACVGTTVTFTNTTEQGFVGSTCSTHMSAEWDFGDPSSGSNNTFSSSGTSATNATHVFSSPGTYTVSLSTTNSCGTSTFTKDICIEDSAPTTSFTLSSTEGCNSLDTQVSNTTSSANSCSVSYNWSVSFNNTACGNSPGSSYNYFSNGSTHTDENPSFHFPNPGEYEVTLTASSSCGNASYTEIVTVSTTPEVVINNIPDVCGGSSATLDPAATVTNCGLQTPTYLWSFPGGSPSTSTDETPTNILYSTPGNYTVTLEVTNECGTTTATKDFTVTPEVLADAGSDVTLCNSETVQLTGSGSGGTDSNFSYSWSPTTGLSNPNTATPIANPSTTTTYNLMVSNGNCSGSSDVTIYRNGLDAGNLSSDQTICSGETPSTLVETLSATGEGTLTYQWLNSADNSNFTNISGATSATYAPPSLTETTYYKRIVTSSLNGVDCTEENSVITIYVNSVQPGQIEADQTICSGGTPNTLQTITSAIATGTVSYQWQSSYDNVNFTDIIGATSETYSPPALTQNTWYQRIDTSTLNGVTCSDITNVVSVSLTTPPSITAQPELSQTLCEGGTPIDLSITTDGSTYTYQWYSNSSNNTTSGTAISGATLATYTPETNAVGTLYYYCIVSANGAGCYDVSDIAVIEIIAAPTIIQQPTSQVICEGDTPNTFSVNYQNGTGTPTYQWYSNTSNATSGGTAVNGATASSYTPPATLGTLYYYVILTFPSGGCNTLVSDVAEITIYQTPVIISSEVQTICSEDTFSISPQNGSGNTIPTDTQYTWTTPSGTGFTGGSQQNTPVDVISQQLVNTTDAPVVSTYTVTPVNNGCTGATFTVSITVNPKPQLNNIQITECSEIAFDYNPVSGGGNSIPTGTTYTWDAPTVTGGITGGTTGTNATSINGTLENPTNTEQTATYLVTPTLTNGTETCTGTPFNFEVTITPVPEISNLSTGICSGDTFIVQPVDVIDGSVPVNTTYSWTAPTPITGISGLSDGSGDTITGTLSNTTSNSITITYTVTPMYNNCIGNDFTLDVVVSPMPTVDPITDITVCNGDLISATTFTGTVPGTTYNWTNNMPSIGLSDSGTNMTPDFTATNNGTTAATATITVTPELNGCIGSPISFTITINPAPLAEFSIPDQTICSGTTSNSVTLSSTTPNTTISWTATIPLGITGATTSGTTTIPTQTLVNSTNAPITVTYIATAITNDATACPGASSTYSIIVTPVPYVNDPQTITTCSASPLDFIPANGGNNNIPTGTTFTWSAPTGIGFTGGTATTSPQTSLNETLINTTNSTVTATYTITPEYGGCTGVPFDVTVTIYPEAEIPNTTIDLCSGESFSFDPATVATILPTGTVYSWDAPTGFVSGGTSGTNATIITGTLSNSLSTQQTATYIITPISPDGNCEGDTFELSVNVNPVFDVSSVVSDYNGFAISSSGANDGTITLTPTGGTGNYTFSWTGPGGYTATAQNISNLGPGDYTVTISDGLCTDIVLTFTLTEPLPLVIEEIIANHINVNCYGANTGSIEVTITQVSIGPFDYALYDSNGNIVESVTDTMVENYVFDNLFANTYSVSVTDANGTIKYITAIDVTQPSAPLAITETITDFNGFSTSCNGAQDAAIDITVTGGYSGYNYTWSGPNGFTSTQEDITNLSPGSYTIDVIDSTGDCTISATYTITEPDVVTFTGIVSNYNGYEVACNDGTSGTIDITPTGGTGVYTYTWTGSGGFTATTEDLTNLPVGTYEVFITDSNGCATASQNFVLTEPTPLSITESHIDVICYGDATGSIDVTLIGGTPDTNGLYTYNWTGPNGFTSSNEDLTNIVAGTYDLIGYDANGCQINLSVTLTQQPEIIITPSTTPISCYGADDATISLDITGGNPPYVVTWANFASGTYQDNLGADDYLITVTDASNCVQTITVTIPQAPIFDITPVVEQISCYGANDGSIALNLVGGQAPVTLVWSDGSTSGTTRNNLPPGTYTVTITDAKPCVINQTFTITEPDPLVITANVTDALDCTNSFSGMVDLIVSGGMPPYTYDWSNGTTNEDLINITNGNYSVVVTDANGCSANGAYTVSRPSPLVIDITDDEIVDCDTKHVYHQYTASAVGGVPPYTFSWSSGQVSGANNEYMSTSLNNGTVLVTVTDGYGCSVTNTFTTTTYDIGEAYFFPTSYTYLTNEVFSIEDPITFENYSTGDFVSVAWNYGDGTYATSITGQHTYSTPGTYVVTLTINYNYGCQSIYTYTIVVTEGYRVMIPTGFTPNGDGVNDYFVPAYMGVTYLELKIFDTWGSLIYYEKGETIKGWDGTLTNTNAENGNYYYHITGETFTGKSINYEGAFTLFK
ncbi:hypothetical protein NBRC110019_13730 [Neptunitalea chrysea]|uniref:PKD domain-containing protein n=1 Tax=Neptunitalea chrysea TaxID=1647581 RepID=A0A9W6B7T5_9FLAO|nr:PKD-like domain-containing protein [Neptunitalea chrysea]GLB52333.1 hypothetical protein NBRC110019_13730 [Neptunitalea chrysea]